MNEDTTQQDIKNAAVLDTPGGVLPVSADDVPGGGLPKVESEPTEEEQELANALSPFNQSPRLQRWVELFLDKNNKETYGNRTECAMRVYDCKNRAVAATIGSQNFKKLNGVASIFADDKGITFEKLMDVAMARALSAQDSSWWTLVMDMLGYRDLKPAVVVQNNTQNNTQYNLNAPEVVDFNKNFKKFLESQ